MILDQYVELNPEPGRGLCKIWIYDDVLEPTKTSSFQHILLQSLRGDTRVNYENRTFTIDNEKFALTGSRHRHNYIKLWSITDYRQFYYQTPETMYDWCWSVIEKDLHPALKYLVDAVERADVFEGKQAIPVRFFVNTFLNGEAMELHVDGGRYELPMDLETKDLWSATYYLQIPKQGGGQLWFANTDFEYMPKVNSLAIFNGNKFSHGVIGGPPGSDDRVSITIRYALVEDMILPGDPDKWLYKPDLSTLTK